MKLTVTVALSSGGIDMEVGLAAKAGLEEVILVTCRVLSTPLLMTLSCRLFVLSIWVIPKSSESIERAISASRLRLSRMETFSEPMFAVARSKSPSPSRSAAYTDRG
ncbi:hypothetical protein ES703_04145 [subsurface metagenome]